MDICPEKIKKLRQDKGWSQQVLAQVSGLSLRTIQRSEAESSCAAETALALASSFDVTPAELQLQLPDPQASWNKPSLMQMAAASVICLLLVSWFLVLSSDDLHIFYDFNSLVYIPVFTLALTVLAFGTEGLRKSVLGLRYLFSQKVQASAASRELAFFYQRQIQFCYATALIGVVIGFLSIYNSAEALDPAIYRQAQAVNLLVLFYAMLLAELVLRPLKAKLDWSKQQL
jgi:transcriptional regulator with XRE-family HTH domain